jgi:hypothetical protein
MFNFRRISLFGAGLAFALTGLHFVACTTEVANGVSEETNTVAGVLLNGSGNAAVGVPVCARHYVYDTILVVDTTDSEGKFGLPISRQGQYGISASKDKFAYYGTINYEGSDVNVSAALEKSGSVEGKIYLRLDTAAAGVKVYIPGSPWETETDKDGAFTLKNVPVGVLPLLAKSPDPIHFVDAVYVVSVSQKSTSFRGPIPTGMFEYFAQSTVEEEPVDDIVNNIDAVGSAELLFPLSPEYGLRSWWPMDYLADAGKGTKKVNDARGGTDGILLYGVDSLEEGATEKALALYGSDQFGVIEGERSILDSAKALTLEAWIRLEKPSSKNYRMNLIGKLGFGSSEDKDVFSLALVQGECDRKNVSLGFFIADGSSNSLDCEDAAFVDYKLFDEWVYVTAVWDGNTSALYVNGVKVADKAVSVTQIGVSSEPIFFGKESVNLKLDDVRLSTSAIGESDVLYRYYLKGGAI